MHLKIHRPSPSLVIAVVALVVATAGVTRAAIPDSDGAIHGCYDKKGKLRVIDTGTAHGCHKKEESLQWNQQGPPGEPGPPGADGPPGSDLFAVVRDDGIVVGARGLISASKDHAAGNPSSDSRFRLTWNRDVSECGASATAASAGGATEARPQAPTVIYPGNTYPNDDPSDFPPIESNQLAVEFPVDQSHVDISVTVMC